MVSGPATVHLGCGMRSPKLLEDRLGVLLAGGGGGKCGPPRRVGVKQRGEVRDGVGGPGGGQ